MKWLIRFILFLVLCAAIWLMVSPVLSRRLARALEDVVRRHSALELRIERLGLHMDGVTLDGVELSKPRNAGPLFSAASITLHSRPWSLLRALGRPANEPVLDGSLTVEGLQSAFYDAADVRLEVSGGSLRWSQGPGQLHGLKEWIQNVLPDETIRGTAAESFPFLRTGRWALDRAEATAQFASDGLRLDHFTMAGDSVTATGQGRLVWQTNTYDLETQLASSAAGPGRAAEVRAHLTNAGGKPHAEIERLHAQRFHANLTR